MNLNKIIAVVRRPVSSPVFRLTVWYVLIIMVISIGFSSVIYRMTAQQVRAGLPPRDRFLLDYGDQFGPPYDQRVANLFEQRYEYVTSHLRDTLIFLNLSVLIGATLASYFLAKRTLKPIEDALDEQRTVTAAASHELRTPLAAMKTEIEVALHGKDANDHAKVLSSNLEEIGKLEHLSTSLLTLARNENGAHTVNALPVELRNMVDVACARVDVLARRKHITIARTGVYGIILGDDTALVDLFVIVLDNALKYSPENSTVTVNGTVSKRQSVVTVTDHGVGIPAADLPHVFRRFYRSDASRSKKQADGYGLGLSIAKQTVERHRGSITIESTEHKGTTVRMAFPRQ